MKSYRASLCVLIGASSYGIHASVVKPGLGKGYSVPDITGLQYLFGLVMLFAAFLFTRKVKMTAGQVASLLGVGVFLSLTGIFYGMSLSLIPASIAVVMLFQFTWIGVLIEALYIRKLPSKKKLVSVLFLWIGTLFAGGLGSSHGFDWTDNSLGLLYGFGAAVTFALFMFFSGKAARNVPTFQ